MEVVDLDPAATWLGQSEGQEVIDEASVALVRQRVREAAAEVGLGEVAAGAIAHAASELAHNLRLHARTGILVTRAVERQGQRGLEVMAADRGAGIPDVARALEGRQSRPSSLGIGMAAVCELADEVDIDVRVGEGTCVWARKFEAPGPRRRRVGVYGRPFPGETHSGDDAAFARSGDTLRLAVADGLGHGDPARVASVRAVRALVARPDHAPADVLAECDRLLLGTRGAVMTAARLDDGGALEIAGVGNVGAHAYGRKPSWRFGGSSFVLGSPGGARRIATERHALGDRDVLVVFSDGIRSRIDLTDELDLLREHPVVVAQRVVERFARPDDDVLVLVAG